MDPIRPDDDDRFAQLLAVFDEQIADGADAEIAAGQETALSPELADRLRRAATCVRVLEAVRAAESGWDTTDDEEGTLHPTPLGGGHSGEAGPKLLEIGRFRLVREVGRGGSGVVFLAEDTELDRSVALKLPRPEYLITAELRGRFLKEARTAASLAHPNIVPIFDAGAVGPVCYIAAEYCRGTSLGQWLRQHGLPDFVPAARLLWQLADAMAHAHSRGVLHRDLKPANVLLEPGSGGDGDLASYVPKVSDFGLAKTLTAIPGTSETRRRAVLGTPAYMAPEQAAGQNADIGPAADVYALGAILYECLTGRPPLQRESDLATLQAVQLEEPTAPRRLRSGIPRDLEAICLKCLEKQIGRRYESAAEFRRDLQRFLDGEPVRARPVTTLRRLIRWTQRNPGLTTAIGLCLATLVAGSATSTALWFRSERQRNIARTHATRADQRASELRVAIDDLFTALAESPELRSSNAEPLRRVLLTKANQFYQHWVRERPDDPHSQLEYLMTLRRLADIQALLGESDEAVRLARRTVEEAEALRATATVAAVCPELHIFLAQRLVDVGEFQAAAMEYDRAMTPGSPEQVVPAHHADLRKFRVQALAARASSAVVASEFATAQTLVEEALSRWEELSAGGFAISAHDTFAVAKCHLIQGQVCERTGRLEDAAANHAEAISLLTQLDKTRGVRFQLAICRWCLGLVRAQQNDLRGAREEYLVALPELESLTQRHPHVSDYASSRESARYSLAVTEMLLGNLGEAEKLLRQSIDATHELLNKYPDLADKTLDGIGDSENVLYVVLARQQNWAAAHAAILRSVDALRKVVDQRLDWKESRMALARAEANLGNSWWQRAQQDAALGCYRASLSRIEPLVREQPSWQEARNTLEQACSGLIVAHSERAEYPVALDACQTLLEHRPDMAQKIHLHEAGLFSRWGRWDDAVRVLREQSLQVQHQADQLREIARKCMELARHLPPPADSEERPLGPAAGTPPALPAERHRCELRNLALECLASGAPAAEPARTVFFEQIDDDEFLRELQTSLAR